MSEVTAKKGFNADERAAARENADITVGEQVFHCRRLSNPVMREVRKYAREAQRKLREIEKLDKKASKYEADAVSEDDAVAAAAEPLTQQEEEQYDKLQDEVFDMNIKQLAVVLRDSAMKPPDEKHLADQLDYRDARDLTQYVLGEEEGTDPTPTTTETSATSS